MKSLKFRELTKLRLGKMVETADDKPRPLEVWLQKRQTRHLKGDKKLEEQEGRRSRQDVHLSGSDTKTEGSSKEASSGIEAQTVQWRK